MPQNKNIKLTKSPIITIILFFLCLCLIACIWTYHQILKTNIKMVNLDKQLNKMKFLNDHLLNQVINTKSIDTKDSNEIQRIFTPIEPEKLPSFNTLIGFQKEKKVLDGFIDYIQNKQNYQGIGEVEAPLGIILYGVPGTGKTTLARALAKETNLPFFEVSSSFFSQKYKGLAPQMVRDLFKIAREKAEANNGVIIFLDECETIFTDLGSLEIGSEIANVVNQFKSEMTSLDNNPEKPIFIVGATNHIQEIDKAIKSRFTYNIEVETGNKEERQKFLEFLIRKRQNPYSPEAKRYLFEVINESLEKLSSEDLSLRANRKLEDLLKEAVSIFARNRTENGGIQRQEINQKDLRQAYNIVISKNNELIDELEQRFK
ncbi:MAG: AAA family ATPase [Weeping tea tree witches'-broom phytoplasma]|uniref:AAA family ATPase n=1 Tax=Candidatus Phytoplasma melaleucae TaxID=2982630 RepID=UPI00293A3089|nr:AAA family ATPase [Weeping tea tree witches'-broom phytoplasma]